MKRMIFAAVASTMLLLVAPAGVWAHARHHHGHHGRTHKHHAVPARIVRFGAATTSASSGSPSTTTTTTSSPENAGTVVSFTEAMVLTIKLNDGSTVSGTVTEETELRCESAGAGDDQGGAGDDQGGGDEGAQGGAQGGGDQGGGESGEQTGSFAGGPTAQEADFNAGDQGAGGQGDDEAQEGCTTKALEKGALVREAALELDASGAVWDQVILVK